MRRITFEKNTRPLPLLLLAGITLGSLLYLVIKFSPTDKFAIANLALPVQPIFFILIAILFYTVTTYVLRSRKHGALVSGFVVIYLLLRLNGLTHPFFLILLIALFLTLELLFTSKKDS